MLSRPRFKSCYSVSTIAPDQLLLLSERGSVCLQEQFLYLVASLVDGDRKSVQDKNAIAIYEDIRKRSQFG
jgi:hypothetical protein